MLVSQFKNVIKKRGKTAMNCIKISRFFGTATMSTSFSPTLPCIKHPIFSLPFAMSTIFRPHLLCIKQVILSLTSLHVNVFSNPLPCIKRLFCRKHAFFKVTNKHLPCISTPSNTLIVPTMRVSVRECKSK